MIEMKKMRAGYPGRPVLEDITLEVHEGEVLAVLGPNGCGKSTLLKTACGLLAPTDGEILLDGVSMRERSIKEVAQRVAYLPQSRSVPNITARRMVLHGRFPYLSYPRRYGEKDWEKVDEALRWVGARELADESLLCLSGGQRQKIYLAMALAQETQTILMDEPTTYLDVGCQMEVMALSRKLAEKGKAVVLVLHDLCMALQYAQRIVLFDAGRIRQIGTPEEVYRSGSLEEVMGVSLNRIKSENGWRYYYQ